MENTKNRMKKPPNTFKSRSKNLKNTVFRRFAAQFRTPKKSPVLNRSPVPLAMFEQKHWIGFCRWFRSKTRHRAVFGRDRDRCGFEAKSWFLTTSFTVFNVNHVFSTAVKPRTPPNAPKNTEIHTKHHVSGEKHPKPTQRTKNTTDGTVGHTTQPFKNRKQSLVDFFPFHTVFRVICPRLF